MAAALTAKVARATRTSWVESGGAIAGAESLRAQAEALIDLDVDAFREARAALVRTHPNASARGGPTGPGAVPLPAHDTGQRMTQTLLRAADVPLAIAEVARDIADVALEVVPHSERDQRPDVLVAVTLAAAGARTAATLVRVNRALEPDDPRAARAAAAAQAADAAEASAYRLRG